MPSIGNVTLKQVRDRSRFRADSGDGAVTDSDLTDIINARMKRLYARRCAKNPADLATLSTPVVIAAGAVSVPDDFFRLLRVDASTDGQNYVRLRAFMIQEENIAPGVFRGWDEVRYQQRGRRVVLSPAPADGAATIRLLYTPLLANLVADADTIDAMNGWEEVIVLDVAAQLRLREQNNADDLLRERNALYAELDGETDNRDSGEPMHVVDVRGY